VLNFLGAAGVGRPTRNTQNAGTKAGQNVQGIHLADQSGRAPSQRSALVVRWGAVPRTPLLSEVPQKRPVVQ